ncbi:MAG: hypothetical protein ACI96N_002806, partial [Arenicella sp.]
CFCLSASAGEYFSRGILVKVFLQRVFELCQSKRDLSDTLE